MGRYTVVAVLSLVLLSSMNLTPSMADASSTTESPQACVRYQGNPVVTQSPFLGANGTERASVLFNGTTFYMWYSVGVGSHYGIGFATSTNGANWTFYPGLVLRRGVNGSWDSGGVYSPSVVWNGSFYLMYFTGVANTVSSRSIGMAFSKDMIHWQEYSENPILVPGPEPYDSFYIRSGTVLFHNHSYQMWYTGAPTGNASFDVAIDYATSIDGIHWAKYAENPVMIDKGGAGSPSVVEVGGSYLMAFNWFYITDATSTDGIHWDWNNLELLNGTGAPSNWEGTVADSSVLLINSSLMLWYTGYGFWTPPQPPAPNPAIGLAYCNLVLLPVTALVTVTSVTTLTINTTKTVTSVYSAARIVSSPDLPVFQALTGILTVSLVASLAMLYRARKHS